jgi:hypothetical protein
VTNLETAWAELDPANMIGGSVGHPSLHDDVRGAEQWEHWAYDLRERPVAGTRPREGTAVGRTEVECVRAMARCLREISEGRVPH